MTNDDERVALARERPLSHQAPSSYRRGQITTVLILILTASALLFRYEELVEWISSKQNEVRTKSANAFIWGRLNPNLQRLGGKVTRASSGERISHLLDSLSSANVSLDGLLRDDYGEYADKAFDRREILGRGDVFTWPSNLSTYRLKRRMKRKVVEAQLGMGNRTTRFTWVTGGHSAAAGHGNLLNQSYTATMQVGAEIAFGAVGVDFVAKHRAMGSTASGPEISLCMDALFGDDIDILWWDYGMTDGRQHWLYSLWSERAGSHLTFPTLFAYGGGENHNELEKRGQSGFALNNAQKMRLKLPDSNSHSHPEDLPPAVAYYRCGNTVENEEPCKAHKWDVAPCAEVIGQTSWHNGWKDHLFMGRLNAVLLTELLNEAVRELAARDEGIGDGPPSLSNEYLSQLVKEEELDRQQFRLSDPLDDMGDLNSIGKDDRRQFMRGNPICHSIRTPSQARCDGLVDGIKAEEEVMPGYCAGVKDHYTLNDMPQPDKQKDSANGTALRPPWMVATDQRWRNKCKIPVNHDFRDAFIVRHEDKWMGDIYPNAYLLGALSRGTERQGIIMICSPICEWGKCPVGTVSLKEVGSENLTIAIDGKPVVGVNQISKDCFVLVGEGKTIKFGPGNVNGRKGQFDIRFLVNKPASMVRISSIITF